MIQLRLSIHWYILPLALCVIIVGVPAQSLAAERDDYTDKRALGLLFRSDLSLAPGGYVQHVANNSGDQADSYAAALGPRLALNLGFAPSRLVRLGLSVSTDFALNIVEEQNQPYTELDGWLRWIAGPTLGFRFGRRVPLELELGVGFSHILVIGSQAAIGDQALASSFGDPQFGPAASALLIYRPGGADSIWGMHAGLLSAWGHSQHSPSAGRTQSADVFTGSLLIGLSVGL